MKNGSSPQVNRHGVPVYENLNQGCRWAYCPEPLENFKALKICDRHANDVYWDVYDHRLEVARQERAKAQAVVGYIYYIQAGAHIKIGWTSDLAKRMKSYPPNCEMLAVEPGTRAGERQLHQKFAVWRSHGREWYPLAPVILDHIRRVVDQYGKPDEVTFGAKPVEVPTPREKQPVSIRPRSGRQRARHIA